MLNKSSVTTNYYFFPTSLQTFAEAERHLWKSMEGEWHREKERILNSLLGSGPDMMEVPSELEVSGFVTHSCALSEGVSTCATE